MKHQNYLMNSLHYIRQNKNKGSGGYLILAKSEFLKHMIEDYKLKTDQ